jgi:hypothetical protein
MTQSIQIEVSCSNKNDLGVFTSVFESNLDSKSVTIKSNESTAKYFGIVSILITAASPYFLERFLLEPFIEPLAERWRNIILKYLKYFQPFDLEIRLSEPNLTIKASFIDHEDTINIWNLIFNTLEILKSANQLKDITDVRFFQTDNQLKIEGLKENKPKYWICIDDHTITEMSEGESDLLIKQFPDEWLKWQMELSQRYQQFLGGLNKLP